MPSYDFEVDLEGLVSAAKGMSDTVRLFTDSDVEDLVPTESAVGHGVVWAALAEFTDRWERGMNNLVGDVEEMAGRLGKVAMTYAEFDRQGHETTTAVAAEVRAARIQST